MEEDALIGGVHLCTTFGEVIRGRPPKTYTPWPPTTLPQCMHHCTGYPSGPRMRARKGHRAERTPLSALSAIRASSSWYDLCSLVAIE
jgi:hypothetical protein